MLIRYTIRSFKFLVVVALLGACSAEGDHPGYEYAPNMYHSPGYEPLKQIKDKDAGTWVDSRSDNQGEYYNSNPYNPHNMNVRQPAPNTVPRREKGFLPYNIHPDSVQKASEILENPLDSTEAVLEEGQVLYETFCDHCHGENGLGSANEETALVGKSIRGVPGFNVGRYAELTEGHIFHVITYGIRRMGAHGSQISIEDRWKIVEYVQTLQNQ